MMTKWTRRQMLGGMTACAALSAAVEGNRAPWLSSETVADTAKVAYPAAPQPPADATIVDVDLVAKRRSARILPASAGPSDIASYSDAPGLKAIRLQHGQWLRAKF